MKMKDLLVHVSSPAKEQLFMSYAALLAKDIGLSVKYLHVHTPGSSAIGMPGSVGTAAVVSQQDIESRLEKIKYHFELQISKINASDPELPLLDYKIETGDISEVMKEYCSGKMVDTVMISAPKERSWLSGDSYQINIIRKLACPVWIIPEGIVYRSFSEILYATDYNQEDIPNLKLLARFAARFPANITAVHVSEDVGFEEKVKNAGFAVMIKEETGYDMIDHKVLKENTGEPLVKELHKFALMVDADLIVLLRENRGFIDRVFHGSRSEKIARETQLPVLIFNEARR
jgi:nucleotide-binding universal stress UspA family protein